MSDSTETRTQGRQATPFRIFLASPGDVVHERSIAREVIDQVRAERRFRDRLNIQVVAWDQPGAGVAMEAGITPQEAIAGGLRQPMDCDLVLVVLWSRIGTPLPEEYLRPDGEPYLSGTEWEYLNAIDAYRSDGQPRVWIYRRTEQPTVALGDPERDDKLDQWQKLTGFLDRLKHSDGSIAGGINAYHRPEEFRRQFEQHLRDHLEQLLEELGPDPVSDAPVPSTQEAPIWTGVPYPGLEVFKPEQAPIFFGRGPEIDQLVASLSDAQTRFMAVVGVSGSGKSSLVAAGLIPRLRDGVIGRAPWLDLWFTPGGRGDDAFLALAYALKEALGTTGETERELADILRTDPARFAHDSRLLLANKPNAAELLIVIDQFEELFTLVSEAYRGPFLSWLEAATDLPRVRIVVTLRADFYATAVEKSELAALLRRDRGTFPLDPPSIPDLQDIISKPAEAAGLELEDGLVARILEDAGSDPGALALVAFAMHALYAKGEKARYLSLADYAEIGGVSGAVRRRAEATLERLQPGQKQGLEALFSHLVEVNEQEVATRRRADKEQFRADALVDALTDARLLVAGKGEGDTPTVEVAHETLLTAWPTLADWIGEHAEALRARRDLERAAAEWSQAGRRRGFLRTGPQLARYRGAAQPRSAKATAFLAACKRRVGWQRAGLGALAAIAIAALVVFWHTSKSHYPPAMAAKGLLAAIALWPVSSPDMVEVPPGRFQMGDLGGEGRSTERPVHEVQFEQAFEIGRYEVTFEEYDLFAAATGRAKPDDEGFGERRGPHPVINVSWEDARAYARWLADETGQDYRLPSEAEWEYAARATTTTPRYWQERSDQTTDPACTYANVFDSGNDERIKARYTLSWDSFSCTDRHPFTAPVGSYEPNAWGLHDSLGNVWEWTQDCWEDSYEGAPNDGTARQSEDSTGCSQRVVRGGSWVGAPAYVRSAARSWHAPANRLNALGFRLARSL